MRKISILVVVFLVANIITSGCSQAGGSDEDSESIRRADSLAAVAAEQERLRLEEVISDSLLQAMAIERYENAVTLEPGEKLKNLVEGTSFYKVEWTCTIKNNTGFPISPADYQIVYEETYEDGNADRLYEVTKERYLRGINVSPDSTAEVVLTGRANTQDLSNPTIKMLISEEEFISRFKKTHKK